MTAPALDEFIPLFKFCSGEGAASILQHEQIFITSPLDLNDPFEMRPGWTAKHEDRQHQNELMRAELTGGIPMFAAMKTGPSYMGPSPFVEAQPAIDVEAQRGISDGLNERVFEILHQRFRVLSLVSKLFSPSGDKTLLPDDAESGEEATLMWSHYAEQFQGVCLLLDPRAFNNGLQQGGFPVQYPAERQSLPPTFYDSYLRIGETAESDQPDFRKSFIDFLTFKSPVWKYEFEVRMIYDLADVLASPDYRQIHLACGKCRALGRSPQQCEQALYRDAIKLPPSAILAVIFGADCPSLAVDRILKILSGDAFKNAATYWTALHSSRYAVHYMRSDAKYIRFFYEHRDSMIAGAKGHYARSKSGLIYFPSKKGETYDRRRRQKSDEQRP